MFECSETGTSKRVAGQGDILTGLIASFISWSCKSINDEVYSKISGSVYTAAVILRLSARKTFERLGFSMIASDIIDYIGISCSELGLH